MCTLDINEIFKDNSMRKSKTCGKWLLYHISFMTLNGLKILTWVRVENKEYVCEY